MERHSKLREEDDLNQKRPLSKTNIEEQEENKKGERKPSLNDHRNKEINYRKRKQYHKNYPHEHYYLKEETKDLEKTKESNKKEDILIKEEKT